MHAKKVKDIKEWIQRNTRSGVNDKMKQSMLILSGPPGSCKTTMINVLAKCVLEYSLSDFSSFSIIFHRLLNRTTPRPRSLGYSTSSFSEGSDARTFDSISYSDAHGPGAYLPYESKLKQFRNYFLVGVRS